MEHLIHFLLRHGYLMLGGFVLAEQLGVPIPAIPVLLGMGALVGRGHFGFLTALVVASTAATAADYVWYWLGRSRGHVMVNLVCRISLERDTCVRRTTDLFARFGLQSLLVSKFIPGLSTAAPPMAGTAKIPAWKFGAWDLAGSASWSGAFLAIGYLLSSQIERVAEEALTFGAWSLALLIAAAIAFVGWKYWKRRQFIQMLRVARIAPEELKQRIDGGEAVLIVDLRHGLEVELEKLSLPGALRIDPEKVEDRIKEISPGREVILFCS